MCKQPKSIIVDSQMSGSISEAAKSVISPSCRKGRSRVPKSRPASRANPTLQIEFPNQRLIVAVR